MDGNEGDRERYIEGYRNQVSYLNGRLKATIEEILSQYEEAPIIIIQGDHGPGSRFSQTSLEKTDVAERYSILNALLLPEKDRQLLYESISPVNTFRIVLNTSLGTNYPLLEDRSYYHPFLQPYSYTAVDESRKLTAGGRQLLEETHEATAAAVDLNER
jgi:hypothetical protein